MGKFVMIEKKSSLNDKLKIIPVFIEKYLTPSGTFIYRQLNVHDDEIKQIVLTSSKTEFTDKFPFNEIYCKKKNFWELYIIKFYEKFLRDRLFFNTYRFLSPSQKRYFRKLLDNEYIRFVHAHYGTGGLEIYQITKELNKKLLVSFHGYDASMLLKKRSYVNQYNKIFNDIYTIVPSEYMRQQLLKTFGKPKKFFVIHYGIPLTFYNFVKRKSVVEKQRNGEKIRFLQISNFVEKKGHEYTIKAFNEILKKNNNLQLIFGGDGVLFANIKKLVSKLGLENKIFFLGALDQKQVKTEMENADVFIHHSVTSSKDGSQEGIPNVIMEAMATGLPVISTYHTGIPELIKDEVNGYLVQERNIEDYKMKIEKVLSEENKQLPLNARKTIEDDFNLSKQLIKLKEVYKSFLD